VNAWFEKLNETFIESGLYGLLFEGLGNTLIITLGALIIGVVIGALIAMAKYFAEDIPALKPIAWFCDLYVTVIRGIPVVVLLLIFYYVIMQAADGVVVGIITFGINSGAYMAEIIRGGINAVDRGQMEAGRSLGLGYGFTMRSIIMPQAFKNVLPALGNEFIVLLKETSVCGYIALVDLTKGGDIILSQTYDAFLPLLAVALIYLSMVVVLSHLLKKLEKRLQKNER
jgi:His/Glu/Gln/Arg/opine family amino acid ABC transporter permease subunit